MGDRQARELAVDVRRSCIVQAPAGSGKTELLIQRMLALLAQVDDARQVLAITFTNKAAAEMRERILGALRSAVEEEAPDQDHKLKTWTLARAVVGKHGDRLLRNPGQLSIQTIDSFNSVLVRRMPWISRFGSVPEISDDPELLYRDAVEQLMRRLDGSDGVRDALEALLRHQDNQVAEVQKLLVNMLRQRDQWLGVLFESADTSKQRLQQTIERYCADELNRLLDSCPAALVDELLWCARYAAEILDEQNPGLRRQVDALPATDLSTIAGWVFVRDLILKSDGFLRERVNKNQGFPSGAEHKDAKERMTCLLKELVRCPEFVRRLDHVKALPVDGYGEEQWRVLQYLFEILPALVAELWLVFRARGQVDFSEIALKAIQSLGSADNPSDLLLKIDQDLRHILVDEFQDTSRLQYRLLNHLISGWGNGDGRTLFLVGDPMQSIYRFREAEVGLFLHCFKGRFGDANHALQCLNLTANFRSQAGIVEWINATFSQVFPARTDEVAGAVPLAAATSTRPRLDGAACSFYPFLDKSDPEEARIVVEIVKRAQSEDPGQSIAILVRSRNHLAEILPRLRREGIPYQAQDIDLLGAKPSVLDIVHLTRALLHRGDRLSWLAVLRAPWCGLTLADLDVLLADRTKTVPVRLDDLEQGPELSSDGRRRLMRVWPILKTSLERRGRVPLRTLVEHCWLSLGGPDCCTAEALADVQRVLDLLETLDTGGDLSCLDHLERGLNRLFAEPDGEADGRLQIMTIHKAKGLEFDTVIIPGLGKMPRNQDSPMLRWFDHPAYGLMIAPVSEKGGGQQDALYRLLGRFENEKSDQETARLLYVATTRAASRLHLLGHARAGSKGEIKAQRGSLLEKLWPAVRSAFDGCEQQPPAGAEEWVPPLLSRLPASWVAPLVTSVRLAEPPTQDVPSEKQTRESDFDLFSGWEEPEHRHVGTVVHQQLEQIARSGGALRTGADTAESGEQTKQRLQGLGVGADRLESAADRVRQAVNGCLSGSRGRWVLSPHQDHACELPLTGVIDGAVVHAVVDRTFIADGIRWVIDYKTSEPQKNESVDAFYRRQGDQYKKQLGRYAQLFRMLDGETPVRTALYFPMLDGWCEVD